MTSGERKEPREQVVRGGAMAPEGGADDRGVVWSLAEESDLNVNVVRLPAGESMARHVNDAVDVLVVVVVGGLTVVVAGRRHELEAGDLAHVPRGMERELVAGDGGATYLTVHRRRGPLQIDTGS